MKPIDLVDVQKRVFVVDILPRLGVAITAQKGWAEGRAPCPVHGSRPGSRSMAFKDHLWYCHRCRKGDTAVSLVCLVKHLPILEAAWWCCEQLGIQPRVLTR